MRYQFRHSNIFKLPAITAIEKIPPFLWHSVGFTHSIVIIFQSYIFQFKLLFKKNTDDL